jgi:hypothetical protein
MKSKILVVILLFFILAIAFFSRSVEVLSKNYLFGFDQGRDYLAVKSMVADHKFTLIGSEIGAGAAGFQGIFHGPFHYYFLSIPFFLMKGDPYGGMILMFLFGMSSVVFSYFLGKKIFGTVGGIITALLISISPPLISQSRFIWNSHPSTLFILLTFYFTYLAYKKENKFIFLSSFFAGFVYNFELAIAIPLSISLLFYYIFVLKLKKIKKYLILFIGFIVTYSPMIFFEIRHNFTAVRGLITYVFNQKDTATSFLLMQRIAIDHFNSFVYSFLDTFPKNIVPPYVFFIIIFAPAIYYFFKEKNESIKKFLIFLALLIPINFFVFSFLKNSVWVYYLIDLNLAYILFFSYSVMKSFKGNNYFLRIFYVLFLLFILIKTLPVIKNIFVYDYGDYGGTAKIKGKIDAMDYIYNDANGEKFSLFVFSPPIYIYPYDYILWWHAKDKFGYMPDNTKKGTFYLLIEEDGNKPWSHKGWIETVIKEGSVVWEKRLSNGFIVQKRIGEK